MKEIIAAFDDKEMIGIGNCKFIINPLTEQIPFTSASLLRDASSEIARRIDGKTTKLVTEEDKGAILVAGVSLLSGLPFGMARWYPSGIANQIKEPMSMEYVDRDIYLNGVQPGDKVTIIDDMISTGGTMIALIKAVEKAGAEITGIICIAEKPAYNGVKAVRQITGYDVMTIIRIDVSGDKSKVMP